MAIEWKGETTDLLDLDAGSMGFFGGWSLNAAADLAAVRQAFVLVGD